MKIEVGENYVSKHYDSPLKVLFTKYGFAVAEAANGDGEMFISAFQINIIEREWRLAPKPVFINFNPSIVGSNSHSSLQLAQDGLKRDWATIEYLPGSKTATVHFPADHIEGE